MNKYKITKFSNSNFLVQKRIWFIFWKTIYKCKSAEEVVEVLNFLVEETTKDYKKI